MSKGQFPERPWNNSGQTDHKETNPWIIIKEMYSQMNDRLNELNQKIEKNHPVIYAKCIASSTQLLMEQPSHDSKQLGTVKPGEWVMLMAHRVFLPRSDQLKDIWSLVSFIPDPSKPIVREAYLLIKQGQDYLFGEFTIHLQNNQAKSIRGDGHEDQTKSFKAHKKKSIWIWLYDSIMCCAKRKNNT